MTGDHDLFGTPATRRVEPAGATELAGGTVTVGVYVPKDLWLTSNRHTIKLPYRARVVRDLHTLAHAAAVKAALQPVSGPVRAVWTVRYPKGVGWVHGEASNAQPTCKALLDAIVAGGWLPDDGPRHVLSETYQRGPNLTIAAWHHIELDLEELS